MGYWGRGLQGLIGGKFIDLVFDNSYAYICTITLAMQNIMLSAFTIRVLVASLLVFFCQKSNAQELQIATAHPVSLGGEGMWQMNEQLGSFNANCNCQPFQNGDGNSQSISISGEIRLSPLFSIGGILGMDFKSTTSSYRLRDTGVVSYDHNSKVTTAYFYILSTAGVNLKYLFIAPYIRFAPFHTGLFLQMAPQIGSLLRSNVIHIHELEEPIILPSGDTALFANGTNKETIDDGPIHRVNQLRIALLFSLGYDLLVSNHFSIVPQLKYDMPITTVLTTAQPTDWKIYSLGIELGARYKFE